MMVRRNGFRSMNGLGVTCGPNQESRVMAAGPGGYMTVCVDKYAEPWTCTWFGVGCKTPAAYTPPPAAPQTREQMTVPGEWTPEQSSIETKEEFDRRLEEYFEQNPEGVAVIPAAAHQAGETLASIWENKGLILALAAGALVMVAAFKFSK